MGKLKIYTFPDQVLANKAAPIDRMDRKELFKLADDMLETMYYAPGIGLAANQVGILKRFVVIDTEYSAEDRKEGDPVPEGGEVIGDQLIIGKKPIILVNPKIVHREGTIYFKEGCLSVPEYTEEVKRSEKIRLEYEDIDGLAKTLDAEGLLAVCIQHELDHLEGKLFIDRLSFLKKDMAKKQLIKERKERERDGE